MEQTPLPPLVGDEELDKWQDQRRGGKGGITFKWSAPKVRDLYESDRLKTREVVQALVSMIHHRHMDHPADTMASAKYYASGGLSTVDALALAKSQLQIEPTK